MRTFIAIPLPEQTIESIGRIQNDLKSGIGSGVAWVTASSIHLTLKFLGEVEENRISDVVGILKGLCGNTFPFTLTCGGLGCFPNSRQPRVLWFGIEPNDQLKQLQFKIEEACFDLGFPKEERSFSPHLTLGRIKNGLTKTERDFLQKKINEHALQRTSIIPVNEVLLFKSELRKSGAVYSVLNKAGLKLESG